MTATGPDNEFILRANRLPFGFLAFAAALASLISCYATIIVGVLTGEDGFVPNPHAQAMVMWGFGILALVALLRDRRQHRQNYPLIVAGIGVVVMIATLYGHYDQRFEMLAYVLLFIGALLNQRAMIAGQSEIITDLNRSLEARVGEQDQEIHRLERLKGFLPATVAELIVQEGNEHLLESHRQYIACLICDLRDFTQFSDQAEPEETMNLLRDYHQALGTLVEQHHGTIGHRAGDGVMVIFIDPLPCEEPVLDAVELALDIREKWQELRRPWERLGHNVGLGIGVAGGYATLGLLGDQGRSDYTAIGNAVNLSSRLCEMAADGEILMDQRALLDVEDAVEAEECPPQQVKGFANPVVAYRVVARRDVER